MTDKKLFEDRYAEIFGVQPALHACTFEIKDGEYVLLSVGKAFKLWQASAKREGFKLVPRKPTQQIYRAFYDAFNSANAGNTAQCFKVGYKAMLSAVEEE
jgi:hypothetical protein